MHRLIVRPFDRPGCEPLTYRDPAELRQQLNHQLAHPDDEARAIGEHALKRALAEHTLRRRLDEMPAIIERRSGRR